MKKLVVLAMVAAALVGCGGDDSYSSDEFCDKSLDLVMAYRGSGRAPSAGEFAPFAGSRLRSDLELVDEADYEALTEILQEAEAAYLKVLNEARAEGYDEARSAYGEALDQAYEAYSEVRDEAEAAYTAMDDADAAYDEALDDADAAYDEALDEASEADDEALDKAYYAYLGALDEAEAAYVKALAAVDEARAATYEQVYDAYVEARAAHDEAYDEAYDEARAADPAISEAGAAYDEARAAYDEAEVPRERVKEALLACAIRGDTVEVIIGIAAQCGMQVYRQMLIDSGIGAPLAAVEDSGGENLAAGFDMIARKAAVDAEYAARCGPIPSLPTDPDFP